MKKRFLIILSALLVFGLVAVAVAFNRANNTSENSSAASSCPMHKQTASSGRGAERDSCCGMADCCKDGVCSMGGACCKEKDSCPMKQRGESKTATGMDMSKVTVVGGGSADSCCTKGADCCKGGTAACCKHKG